MDWHRIVELHGPTNGSHGSGYLLAPGLVLTARHVVEGLAMMRLRLLEADADGLPAGVGAWQSARVVWCGSGGSDLALLVPADAAAVFRTPPGGVTLGRLDSRSRAPVRVDALGFPRAAATATHSDTLHVEAWVDPLTAVRAAVLQLQVTSSRPADAQGWRGMSGAAVFAADRLVGVVEAVPAALDDHTLRVVPVHPLLDDAEAVQLLQAAGLVAALPAALPRVDADYVSRLPRAGDWRGLRETYTRAVVTTLCRVDHVGYAVGGAAARRIPALAAYAAQRFVPGGAVSGDAGTDAFMGSVLTLIFGGLGQRFDLTGRGLLGAEWLTQLPRVVIVAEGGAGKSTVLRQMLARAAGGGALRVPVWVSLARLPQGGALSVPRFITHLVAQARDELGLVDVTPAFFEALAQEGQLVIALDALDECGSLARRQQVRELIVELARQWPGCTLFVSSRPDALRDTPLPLPLPEAGADLAAPDRFYPFGLAPFGPDDIVPFMASAFDDGARLGQDIAHRTGIEALIRTPLTLTLVGLVARSNKGLPANRTQLFARCLDTVCETWEDTKGAAADGLLPAQRLDVLRWLGWTAQRAGGDELDAPTALAAIGQSDDAPNLGRARTVLDGLARRNLLLRAETGPGTATAVRSLRFAHPQFREYLAGAHLAEHFMRDAGSVVPAMAPHWLDTTWLDVLRFATATLDDQPSGRDAFLRAVLDAPDPWRDLLHRPEFLAVRLLARLRQADAAIVADVVDTLAHAALHEPALRHDAAQALLDLGHHPAATPVLERLARGEGVAQAFEAVDADDDNRNERWHWRLGAVAALGTLPDRPVTALRALEGLPARGAAAQREWWATRHRIGDTAAALAGLEQLFVTRDDDHDAVALAATLDELQAGAHVDRWLVQALAADPAPGVRLAQLGLERGVLPAQSPQWPALFERAAALLAQNDPAEDGAPPFVSEACYLALGQPALLALPAAQALLIEALRHRSLVWYVGPHLLDAWPALAAPAVAAMGEYVVDTSDPVLRSRAMGSRLRIVIGALCRLGYDTLAVPVLQRLVERLPVSPYDWQDVARSLLQRGVHEPVHTRLRQRIALPAGVDDRHPDDASQPRAQTWWLAWQLDAGTTRAWLEATFRSSADPVADARHLMTIWRASGIERVAGAWFALIADEAKADAAAGRLPDDTPGWRFLHTLTTCEHDTAYSDLARHVLYGSVFDDQPEPRPPPPTLAQLQRRFTQALERDRVQREGRDTRDVGRHLDIDDVRGLGQMLGQIAKLADVATALALADTWLHDALADAAEPLEARADRLFERLQAIGPTGLRAPQWRDLVADLTREIEPAQRVDLIGWLRANA